MAVTITTIRDVFKHQVSHNVIVPTIWIDKSGIEHEDWELESISARSMGPDSAYIKQVGSHVKIVVRLCDIEFYDRYADLVDVASIFKYAINLRIALLCFSLVHSLKDIPENLFWNCPKLEKVDSCFADTDIVSIPEKLFKRSKNLTDASGTFRSCSKLTDVPENLFSNCPLLKDVGGLFESCTSLEKIPDRLFKDALNLLNVKNAFKHTKRINSGLNDDPSICLPTQMYQDLLQTKAVRKRSSKLSVTYLLFGNSWLR